MIWPFNILRDRREKQRKEAKQLAELRAFKAGNDPESARGLVGRMLNPDNGTVSIPLLACIGDFESDCLVFTEARKFAIKEGYVELRDPGPFVPHNYFITPKGWRWLFPTAPFAPETIEEPEVGKLPFGDETVLSPASLDAGQQPANPCPCSNCGGCKPKPSSLDEE